MAVDRGTGLTLAEELLLIALDDERGVDRANWGMGVESGLAGECEPPADRLLADALAAIAG